MNYILNNFTVFVENNPTYGFFKKDVFISQVNALSPEKFKMLDDFVLKMSLRLNIIFPNKIKANSDRIIRYYVQQNLVIRDYEYVDDVMNGLQLHHVPYIDGLNYFFPNLRHVDQSLSLQGMIQEAQKG